LATRISGEKVGTSKNNNKV